MGVDNYGNRQTNTLHVLHLCGAVHQRQTGRSCTLLPALQYKPRARVRYQNQKKVKLEKIQRKERY